MCGIAGYVGCDDQQLLHAMGSCLAHRGPDDAGYYTAPGVGLAHRRLSIIDLKSGHQPMANEDHTVWTVFNGEIYNYQEVRARLMEKGHRFSTTSDTEVIVHLYEDKELDFLEDLRGMFALGVWDTGRKRLVLARDRTGEKPLFYAADGRQLFFGSEIKALLQRRGQPMVRAQAVCDFLAMGYVPAPRTFYDHIEKLAPGHMLVHQDGCAMVKPYWQRGQRYETVLSFEEAKRELSERLSETVKLCLKSDVEVGGFLSGGVDSSTIVALMRRHAAQVQTFAVGFGGAATGYNELSHAKLVADAIGSTHHELILEAKSSVELLPKILWHYDEPHGEPTSVLVYLLCEFTQRFVKVALGGTGGDEIFHGYPRYTGIRLLEYYRRLPKVVRRNLVERVLARWPESSKGGRFIIRARRLVQASDLPTQEAYLNWVSLLDRDIRTRLLSETVASGAEDPVAESVLRHYLCGSPDRDMLDRATDLDVGGYLPEYQLCYMDRMSMAHGLEVRSPLCDYDLLDFATSLPSAYRLKGRRSKHIFKEVADQWIPSGIVNRPKRGFDSPIGEWIKGDLRDFIEGFLSRENLKQSGLLNPEAVAGLLGEHLSGRRNYSLQLWSILALEAWYRMYIEDSVTEMSSYSLESMRGGSAGSGRTVVGSVGHGEPSPRARRHSVPPWRERISRKRLWDATPEPVRRCLGPALERLNPSWLLGRDFREKKVFAQQAQWWPADQVRQYQLQQARLILTLAYQRTRYYRESFDRAGFQPRDLQSLEDLGHLPTIVKTTIIDHLTDMHTTDDVPCDYTATGGTSGNPLQFHINADRSATEYAYLVTSWERAGYRLGMPMAVLRGRVVKPDRSGFYHEHDPVLRHHYYSNFHMTDANMARYREHLATLGPCCLHVYPSSIAAFCRFLLRQKLPGPENVRCIIAESEIVYPEQRKMVEEVFRCRFFSCYGHTEKLVLASECEHSHDYHVWPTYGYFELLDENGQSVSTPGRRGEIVGTGFINTVMPFIRYRTGDWATYVGAHCEACGREHTLIRDIRGHRTQEVLIAADGSEISWTALNMHDDTFTRVRQFQFVQEAPGRAVLRLVPGAGYSEADDRRIQRSLGRKLDGQLTFTIESVEAIALTAGGKAIYVDQRIPGRRRAEGTADTL